MRYLKGVKWFLVAITFSTTIAADIIIDNQSIPGSDIQSITISPTTGFIFVTTIPGYTVTPDDVVPPPPGVVTISLSATPTTITEGQSTLVSWSTQNATSCAATGGAGNWEAASVPLNGSNSIAINTAGTYSFVLSCTGTSGTVQEQVGVTVNQSTPVPDNCEPSPLVGTTIDWASFWNGTAFPNPIYSNEYADIPRNGYMAIEFNTANFVDTGQLSTIEVTGTSGSRLGAISQCPGDFDVVDECQHGWGTGGGILWSTEDYPDSCILQPNTTYYVNITFTDGVTPDSTDCRDTKCITKVRTYNP